MTKPIKVVLRYYKDWVGFFPFVIESIQNAYRLPKADGTSAYVGSRLNESDVKFLVDSKIYAIKVK